MDENRINQTAELFKVIANPLRLKIIMLLAKEGPCNVTSIQNQLQIDQAFLSHNLIKLRDKELLIRQRKGKEMYYEVNGDALKELTYLIVERLESER